MSAVSTRKLLNLMFTVWCVGVTSSCPVSRQCTCTSDRNEDIICDIGKTGLPTFTAHDFGQPYKAVVVTGSHIVTNFMFYGLRVESVVLRRSNISYVPCQVFSGLEADLKHIDISGNALGMVPSCALIGLNVVTHLNLSHNLISRVREHSFAGLPALVHLDLSHNMISAVSPLGFQGLDNLLFLNLSWNALFDVDKDLLKGLDKLNYLDLSSNGLVRLHEDVLLKSRYLSRLDLSENRLSMFTMRHLEYLSYLSLRDNRLERLFEYVFKECTSLEELDLSVNMMAHFPSFVMSMPKLRRFSMAHNYLSDLDLEGISRKRVPFSLIDLSNNRIASVTSVYLRAQGSLAFSLRGNNLTTAGNVTVLSVDGKTSSVNIDMSSNLLRKSPAIRYQINHQRGNSLTLNLSNNRLDTYDDAEPDVFSTVPVSLTNVRVSYDFSHNRLNAFPKCPFFLRYKMDVLDLSSNLLTEFPIGGCIGTSVKQLLLNDNKLTRLNKIYFGGIHKDAPILQRLELARNRIKSVTNNAFDNLSNSLRQVDLRLNLLESLPKAALSVDSLEALYLEGNPLNCVCTDSIHTAIFNWTLLADNSRCTAPTDERGYLFKCYWQNCTRYGPKPLDCSSDNYLGMRVNISDTERGFNVSWTTFGPGKLMSIRLNVSETGRTSPTFVHLIHPQVRSYLVVNVGLGHNYSVCVDALSTKHVILASSCFTGLQIFSKPTKQEYSTTTNHHKTWLIVICVIFTVFLVLVGIYCFTRRKFQTKRRGRCDQRREPWRCNLVDRMLQCMKLSRYMYESPSDSPVVMTDLLLNEQYSHSRPTANQRDNSADDSPSNQPPLPPRNSSLLSSRDMRPTDSDNEPTKRLKRKPQKTVAAEMPNEPSGAKGSSDSTTEDMKCFDSAKKPASQNVYESGFELRVNLDQPKLTKEYQSNSSSEENIYEDTYPLDSPPVHVKPSCAGNHSPIIVPKRLSGPQTIRKDTERETPCPSSGYECPVTPSTQATATRDGDDPQRGVVINLSNPTYSRIIRKLSSDHQ